jgi:glucosamine 6-phosphate synthetase-like amidotransferase/phosphosugar isomerase protein
MNEHEDYNRGIKVGKLVAVLNQSGATADQVENLDDEGKRTAERLAGTTEGSERTWSAVVGTLRGQEQAAAAPDPFAGLPKGNV